MYTGLVLCRHKKDSGTELNSKKYLFACPPNCGLQTNDEVIVQTQKGEEEAVVVSVCPVVEVESPLYRFIVACVNGASTPLAKVLKKKEITYVSYLTMYDDEVVQ